MGLETNNKSDNRIVIIIIIIISFISGAKPIAE